MGIEAWSREPGTSGAFAAGSTVRHFLRMRGKATAMADEAGDVAAPFDAIILGGGAAGLTLACALARAGWGDRVVIVDDESLPLDPRAWAWWSAASGPFTDGATRVFRHLESAGHGWNIRSPLDPYAYYSLTGAALSAATDTAIAALPGYQRLRGRAIGVEQGKGVAHVSVEFPGGKVQRLSAPWVFDSVGVGVAPVDPRGAPHLDFLGLVIESDRDVFDPTAVTLMDFGTDQEDGVAFVYVLPASPRVALVERTVFVHPQARNRTDPCRHEDELAAYVRDVLAISAVRAGEGEKGVIPLVTRPALRPRGSVVPIGAQAGMVRSSTGYALERIQRHSEEIARCLLTGKHPGGALRAERWPRILDDALLRVVRQDPDAVRTAFASMLTRHPIQRTLAFLDCRATVTDQIALFSTLPLWRFTRAQVAAVLAGRGPEK